MRTVLVDLDTGRRLGLGVGVATDVVTPFEHEDSFAQLGGRPLGDGETEESGATTIRSYLLLVATVLRVTDPP